MKRLARLAARIENRTAAAVELELEVIFDRIEAALPIPRYEQALEAIIAAGDRDLGTPGGIAAIVRAEVGVIMEALGQVLTPDELATVKDAIQQVTNE